MKTPNGTLHFDFSPRVALHVWRVVTPWGSFAAVTDEEGRPAALAFPATDGAAEKAAVDAALIGHPGARVEKKGVLDAQEPLAIQLREFAAGSRGVFDTTLALGQRGVFESEVWKETARIPFGRSASYGEIARRIGRPRAFRAVGGALGRNPLPLIVPCHRVIQSGGGLGGFTGGLDWKKRLLDFESHKA